MARKKQIGRVNARGVRTSLNAAVSAARMELLEERRLLASIAVTTTLDVTDPNDGVVSLREAVALAAAQPGDDTVMIPAGAFHLVNQPADALGYVSPMIRV